MSLSKKKYSFHHKKSENKENINNTQQLYNLEAKSEINENNKVVFDQKISFNDLICQTYTKEKRDKEWILPIPLPLQKNKNDLNEEKKEENNLSNNNDLQYLINQNETENIDFINTLLKLKGIPINNSKSFNSTKKNYSSNFEEKNNTIEKSPKKNNIELDSINKYNKTIPSNCSILTSKINNTINNYNNEKYENGNPKNLDTITFSINEINSDNINLLNKKVNNSSCKTNINLVRLEKNLLLNELITLENEKEKINYINSHTNKETVSSSESNTNITLNVNRKTDSEYVNVRDNHSNSKYQENLQVFENNKNIDNNKNEKKNHSFNKKTIDNKSFQDINNKKSLQSNKEQLNSSEKKIILKKKLIRRIPHSKNKYYDINKSMNNMHNKNKDKNEQKEKKTKSKSKSTHILVNDMCNYKKISKTNSKCKNKNNSKIKNNINKNISELITNNITLIKPHHSETNLTKIKHNNTQKNNHIYNNTEIKHLPNKFDHNKNKINKKLIFEKKKEETKNNQEQVKERHSKNIKNNYDNNNKKGNNKISTIINKKSAKNNYIYDIPFNTERKTVNKFKTVKIQTEISPKKINNALNFNSKNESNKNINKYKNTDNLNSNVKKSKNKIYISPSLKNLNKKNLNKANDYDELLKKNKYNSLNNNNKTSINNNINKNNLIEKENINNYEIKMKKSPKIFDKIHKNKKTLSKENYEEEDLDVTIDINNSEFNDDEIKESKNSINNKKINKKPNKSKFAEIFLFDD